MAEEIELKLAMSPENLARLSKLTRLDGLKPTGRKAKRLQSTYFDTPDFILRRNGMALRIRKVGKKRIQTLKIGQKTAKKRKGKSAGEQSSATHRRQEIESEISSDDLDLSKISSSRFHKLIGPGENQTSLKPVFVSEIDRQSFLLNHNGTSVEIALDHGTLRTEKKSETICEAELELLTGSPDFLPRIALAIPQDIPFRLEQLTKSDRGYALTAPVGAQPKKSAKTKLSRSMPVAGAFRTVLHACIGQMRANEAVVLCSDMPEGVHQFRVAVRRLRAALVVFECVLPVEQSQSLEADLSWLQGAIGKARDWDVLLAETIGPMRERSASDNGLYKLEKAALAAKADAYEYARTVLNDSRYARLLLRLELLFTTTPNQTDGKKNRTGPVQGPISELACSILQKRFKKLLKRKNQSSQTDEASLHRVRIAVKKLRYAIEFFPDLYHSKQVKHYLEAVIGLQDILGKLNDSAAAQILLAELESRMKAAGRQRDVRIAIGKILGWHDHRVSADFERFELSWHKFSSAAPFWRKR